MNPAYTTIVLIALVVLLPLVLLICLRLRDTKRFKVTVKCAYKDVNKYRASL